MKLVTTRLVCDVCGTDIGFTKKGIVFDLRNQGEKFNQVEMCFDCAHDLLMKVGLKELRLIALQVFNTGRPTGVTSV